MTKMGEPTPELKTSGHNFKRRSTIPVLNRSSTQRSLGTTLGFESLTPSPKWAPNGNAATLRQIFWQFLYTYTHISALGSTMMMDSSRSLPPLVSPAFAFGLPEKAKVRDLYSYEMV